MRTNPENPSPTGAQQLKNFRQSMKVARQRAGMTQTDLANAMNERGHAFRQQTVQKIESGDRSLQFEEAAEVADIVGVPLERLARGSAAFEALTQIYDHMSDLATAAGKAAASIERCLELQGKIPASMRLAAMIDSDHDLAEQDRETFLDAMAALAQWSTITSADELLAELKVGHLLPDSMVAAKNHDESSAP